MPRQRLSEYRSKQIISQALNLPYRGWTIDAEKSLDEQLSSANLTEGQFAVKVDQGIKGRFKRGLVKLGVTPDQLKLVIGELSKQGFRWFIIEPMAEHDASAERYLSLVTDRGNLAIKFTPQGGVEVEQAADTIQTLSIDHATNWELLAQQTGFTSDQLQALVKTFRENFFVFLEINPYMVDESGLKLLDIAVELDDAGEFFVKTWRDEDLRSYSSKKLTPEEEVVRELDLNSPASLKLSVLEPNGSIFLLLSGGGASVVVADEVYNQGYGKQLANYGEYSGNPNSEETYAYTKAVLQLLLKSEAAQKVVFIGGAVANFTDVAKTFAGVIKAIDETADQLKQQGVKVYVRRGGPNQEAGLALIEGTLKKHDLLGAVHDPSTPLTVAVNEALQELSK